MEQDQPIWEQFVALAQSPDDEIDLATAALLIAATEYPQLDISHELGVLDSLSAGVFKAPLRRAGAIVLPQHPERISIR